MPSEPRPEAGAIAVGNSASSDHNPNLGEIGVESGTSGVAVGSELNRNGISTGVYDDLVYYFQYASSAYILLCPRPNGNHLVSHNTLTATQGFVARDDQNKELVVALRGSGELMDIILDSQVLLVPCLSPGVTLPKGNRVHSGFLTAWNSVAVEVIPLIKAQLLLHPGYTIVTVGHSLGGAVATLAGVCLRQLCKGSQVRIYSYGAPRTGNQVFANHVNESIGPNAFRVVHADDGVPTMIPKALGYAHHGVEYWVHTDPASAENTRMCSPDGEDPTCSASLPSRGIGLAHTMYFGILVSTPFCL